MTDRTIVAARWVLPIDQPAISRGWVEISEHRIVRIGRGTPPEGARDLGDVALLPGLVNAHTHLELSWLDRRVPPADSFVDWVRAVLAARADVSVGPEFRRAMMRQAAEDMRMTGTVAVGDVTNTLASIPILGDVGLAGMVFYELLGFTASNPRSLIDDAWVRLSAAFGPSSISDRDRPRLGACVAAHAPFSVSPELFAEVGARHPGGPLTVHLGESVEEMEFLRKGTGPLRKLLEDLGVWRDDWSPPACDPAEYLARLGYLRPGMLAVHAVHLSASALDRLREAEAVIVTCPRSNTWVGAGLPPLARFYASGVDVAVGTDSLASVGTLNLFDELAELRRIAPDVAAASLLESATRIGAKALGLGHDYGTIASGKRADLVSVVVPVGTADVEEYLVSGVPASAVRLLEL